MFGKSNKTLSIFVAVFAALIAACIYFAVPVRSAAPFDNFHTLKLVTELLDKYEFKHGDLKLHRRQWAEVDGSDLAQYIYDVKIMDAHGYLYADFRAKDNEITLYRIAFFETDAKTWQVIHGPSLPEYRWPH